MDVKNKPNGVTLEELVKSLVRSNNQLVEYMQGMADTISGMQEKIDNLEKDHTNISGSIEDIEDRIMINPDTVAELMQTLNITKESTPVQEVKVKKIKVKKKR